MSLDIDSHGQPHFTSPRAGVRWDLVSLGEIMLRLDPGDMRIHTTRSFRAWEGGGEYNVARGLRRCFGRRTAVVTALADNPVGRLIEDLVLQGGVDTALIRWVPYDGTGKSVRNGLNFTERGFGLRGALGCSDRGNTAASQMKPGEVDWDHVLGREGARWLHTGGIFAALSPTTAQVVEEAMIAARRHGVTVSYDLNYRPSLWSSIGGQARAREVNRALVAHADVLFGNEEDLTAALGLTVEGLDDQHLRLEAQSYARTMERAIEAFPNLKIVATTLRAARSATVNDWSALCVAGKELYQSTMREGLLIHDRVGGGDSFASGFIHGLLAGREVAWALECGAAHGALAMTTPGDTSMATLAEVEKAMKGGSPRVER
jgi:2-dehydro-3-deoxygluconokinase